MFQGKNNNNNIFIFILFVNKFQFQQDPRIAVVADGFAVVPPGLKCFKEKKTKKN
jgi:hypothetical protein